MKDAKTFLNGVAFGLLIYSIFQILLLYLFPLLQEKGIKFLKNIFRFDAKSLSRSFIIIYFGFLFCAILINAKIIVIKELKDMPITGKLAVWLLLIASLLPAFQAKRAIKDENIEERKIAILKLRQIFFNIILIFTIFVILSLGYIKY